MNALTEFPNGNGRRKPPPKPSRPPRPRRSDQEFLAPALEILETPPSPIRMRMILVLCTLVVATLAWTWFGRIDIIATADGKIEPTGKVKVIQPLQTGKIVAIPVRDGDPVTAGETIVKLDPVQAQAELTDESEQLEAAEAEVERRKAAIDAVASLPAGSIDVPVPRIAWSEDVPANYRTREEAVLDKDLLDLKDELVADASQIAQKETDARSVAATITAQQSLVDTLGQLAAMKETLVSKDAGSKADWLDALQTQKTQEVTLATDLDQQADTLAGIDVLKKAQIKTIGDFLADHAQKLEDAAKTADDLAQKVKQAQSALDEMTLESPIDGVVQGSAITTVGQVVSTGQELMRIVPVGRSVVIQAYLPNDETGFVTVGQPASVKIAAFPYTQYGTVPGKVIDVGRDAVTAADAQQALEDPSHAQVSGLAGTADQTNNLVFPITVQLDNRFIRVGGKDVPLSPGMSVSVDVDTGSRRILEYLFSPIVDITASAMHER
jgi:hemolysin D